MNPKTEIQPVQEEILTIVARENGVSGSGASAGAGGLSGASLGGLGGLGGGKALGGGLGAGLKSAGKAKAY